MASLDKLKRKLATTNDLHTVVTAMKTLSAVNIRQYEAAVTSLSQYAKSVAQGLQVVMQNHTNDLLQETSVPLQQTVVIVGSDTGLCGRFNEAIVELALQDLAATESNFEETTLIAVGGRVALELEVRNRQANSTLQLPSSLHSITKVAQNLFTALEQLEGKSMVRRHTLLYYNRPAGLSHFKQRSLQVYPLDPSWLNLLAKEPWDSRSLPIYTMDWQALFSALVREYYFVSLHRTLAESLASENAARLAAMQAAEQNIEERLNDLTLKLNQLRQVSITEELQDIMAGTDVQEN